MNHRASVLLALAGTLSCAAPAVHAPSAPTPPARPEAVGGGEVSSAPAPGPDRTTPPVKGPAPELRLPEQRHFRLRNGLAVRLVEHHRLPIVALNLVVDAGGARDPAGRPGLASFTAAMLTEGTKTRSATRISDEVGFLGATLGAAAAVDSATLAGATLSKHLEKYLELFADVARNAAFPKRDFERVQDERLVTLLQQRDQPQAIASRAFAPLFWGAHPYGHTLLGTEESVKAMRPKDLAAFYARHWRPGSSELVVVGDVTEEELRALLERTIGAWAPGPHLPPLTPAAPAAPKRTVLLEKADAPQAFLLIGMPGIARSSDEYVAASVAFQVLGGGMASRLFRNLREDKGYTYGVYARSDARKLGGVSYVIGSVKADVTGAALRELLGEIERMREEKVPADELDEAKDALVLSLPADFATAGGTAGRLAELALHGLPDDYWNGYAERVRKVTAEDVQRFARERLDPSRLTLVMVASPDVVGPQLADLPTGPLEIRQPETAPRPAKAATTGAR